MKICYQLLFNFWGVLGNHMLNLEVLKCAEDLITLETEVQQRKTIDNVFHI